MHDNLFMKGDRLDFCSGQKKRTDGTTESHYEEPRTRDLRGPSTKPHRSRNEHRTAYCLPQRQT